MESASDTSKSLRCILTGKTDDGSIDFSAWSHELRRGFLFTVCEHGADGQDRLACTTWIPTPGSTQDIEELAAAFAKDTHFETYHTTIPSFFQAVQQELSL